MKNSEPSAEDYKQHIMYFSKKIRKYTIMLECELNIKESTRINNKLWNYQQSKNACENLLAAL